MGVRDGKKYSTVNDLQGQRLGTVTGYVWVKSIKSVPGAKLGAYPNANGVFDDLGAGRLDAGFLDPLLITYYEKQRPDAHIQAQYLTPPDDAEVEQHPDYAFFRPYMTSFYIPKQEPKLEQARTCRSPSTGGPCSTASRSPSTAAGSSASSAPAAAARRR